MKTAATSKASLTIVHRAAEVVGLPFHRHHVRNGAQRHLILTSGAQRQAAIGLDQEGRPNAYHEPDLHSAHGVVWPGTGMVSPPVLTPTGPSSNRRNCQPRLRLTLSLVRPHSWYSIRRKREPHQWFV